MRDLTRIEKAPSMTTLEKQPITFSGSSSYSSTSYYILPYLLTVGHCHSHLGHLCYEDGYKDAYMVKPGAGSSACLRVKALESPGRLY